MIMGDLRKALHKEVSSRVVAEVSKDTNMPPHEIERVLTLGNRGLMVRR
jgi:protein required for attachment to host cells